MGWTFRKSFTLGPFRINFSKSGISYSFGMFGYRTGVNTKGRRYTSVSVPGTGFNYRKTHPTKKTKAPAQEESEE